MITIRGTAFDPYKEEGGESNFISLELPNEIETNRFISMEETKTERPELSSARIVISGGRGIGSTENFKII